MNGDRSRSLRKNMTDTERFVWQRLRYRQMANYKFRRQMPVGPYVIDFVCLERRLIIELDGGQHADQPEKDATWTAWLEGQGFKVLRFWNHEALKDWEAVEMVIWKVLTGETPPHPNPPPQGGREQKSPPPQGGREQKSPPPLREREKSISGGPA